MSKAGNWVPIDKGLVKTLYNLAPQNCGGPLNFKESYFLPQNHHFITGRKIALSKKEKK
jgi:hypothetical protein